MQVGKCVRASDNQVGVEGQDFKSIDGVSTSEECKAKCSEDSTCKGTQFDNTNNLCAHWYVDLTGDQEPVAQFDCEKRDTSGDKRYKDLGDLEGA